MQQPLRGEQKLCCAVVAVVGYLPCIRTADKGGELRCSKLLAVPISADPGK